jgi:hypothetical protein
MDLFPKVRDQREDVVRHVKLANEGSFRVASMSRQGAGLARDVSRARISSQN